MADKLPILLLVRNYIEDLSYFDDWTDALTSHPGFEVEIADIATKEGRDLAAERLAEIPFTVCLHSTTGDGVDELNLLLPHLQSRKGKLAVFVANELNLPLAPMSSKISFLKRAAADIVLTQFIQDTGDWFYEPVASAKVVSLPHALNADAFSPGAAQQDRLRDVGARSHRYSVHVGDVERVAFLEFFARLARQRGLEADIKLGSHRFDRAGWSGFLRESRATLATEAGSHYTQRDDEICNRIQELLLKRSERRRFVVNHDSYMVSLFQRLVPKSIKQILRRSVGGVVEFEHELARDLTTEEMIEIQSTFFTEDKRAAKYTKVISSRHFDAIGSKTVQVMPFGQYNGVLSADKHYLAVSADHANIEEVMARLEDLDYCQGMADETFDYVMEEHRYAHRCIKLESELRALK